MIRVGSPDDHGLALDLIQIDGGTQSRATLNDQVVKEVPLALIVADSQAQPRKAIKTDVWVDYQEAMERGDTFPPVTVFYDGSKYWLADGFHRVYAARGIGKTEIRCEIHEGSLRDAVLYSVGVNHAHGLQRTDADRRRAIMLLLEDEEWGQWSDREIARRCKVHHTTVARVKADIRAFYQGESRDAGGKYRPGREAVWDDPRIERITGDVASDSHGRKFRSKHGTTATMKTAGINAGRKVSTEQPIEAAKVTTPDANTHGQTGTADTSGLAASVPASRKAEAKEVGQSGQEAAVELPVDAGEAASVGLPTIPRNIVAEILALWGEASPSERDEVLAQISPNGADSSTVWRPAEAAHSSPDTEFKSAAPTAEPEAIPSPPPASGAHSNPQEPISSPVIADKAEASTSSPSASATHPSPAYLAGDDGHRGIPSSDALAAGQGGSPDSIAKSGRAVTNLNPRCQKPATCKWAHSQASCSVCSNAWMKSRAAA